MRPTIDLDPGLLAPPSSRSGTGRHTVPDAPLPLLESGGRLSLGDVADGFFSQGDAGTYEGGPATVDAEASLEEPAALAEEKTWVRTPEMDARRARFVRVVATVVGGLAGVLALGVVRASASERDEAPPTAVVAAPSRVEAAAALAAELSRVEGSAASAEAPPGAAAPAPAPAAPPKAVTPAGRPRVSAPLGRATALEPPSSPAIVAPSSAPALPSVASFAARAGDPVKSASGPPTASFAPVR